MNQARNNWIDASRGIGIILVVICHIFFEYTRVYIYSFIIPLFFYISGALHNKNKYKNSTDFIKSRIRSLLYPYFIWSLILFVFWAIADSEQHSIAKGFIGIFYASCNHDFMDWGMMLWFIPTLFITEIVYDFIIRRCRKPIYIILGLTIIGFTYNHFYAVQLPWGVNISLVMLFFYYIGNISMTQLSKIKNKQRIISLPLLFLIYYFSSKFNGEIFSEQGVYQNPVLYIMSGLSGTLFILLLCQSFRCKMLELIGMNSLFIMILHLRAFTFFKIIEKYILKIEHQDTLLSISIYVVMAVTITCCISIFIKKNLTFLGIVLK